MTTPRLRPDRLRPMLAAPAPEDLDQLRLPLLASPKIDGIRCLIVNGRAVSRTLKPIRNHHIQSILGNPELNGLDGEIVVGSPTAPNAMQATTSGVMSAYGEPDFQFHVFDEWDSTDGFAVRRLACAERATGEHIIAHEHTAIHDIPTLEQYESSVLALGYEGLILRDIDAPYKFNRSTQKQGWMLKLKRFVDAEAICVGYEELMINANEPTLDERGFTKRSTSQDNKYYSDTLGSLTCRLPSGLTFNVGTGFDAPQRRLLWSRRDSLVGRIVKFKSFPHGVKEKPRHPVFLGLRAKDDLSDSPLLEIPQ